MYVFFHLMLPPRNPSNSFYRDLLHFFYSSRYTCLYYIIYHNLYFTVVYNIYFNLFNQSSMRIYFAGFSYFAITHNTVMKNLYLHIFFFF